MALPAFEKLKNHMDFKVICPQQTSPVLSDRGFDVIEFDFPIYNKFNAKNILATYTNLKILKKMNLQTVIDFNSDPRTSFFLKLAGIPKVISYLSKGKNFFDEYLTLPSTKIHQVERNLLVIDKFISDRKLKVIQNRELKISLKNENDIWYVFLFSETTTKNWSLNNWERFLDNIIQAGENIKIMTPIQVDRELSVFIAKTSAKYSYISNSLLEIDNLIARAKGVITIDSFPGHVAATHSKPVFWINGSSDSDYVSPYNTQLSISQIDPMECRPCLHNCTNPIYKSCLINLESDKVLQDFELFLRNIH